MRLNAEFARNGRLIDITPSLLPRWSPDGSLLSYRYAGGLYVISGQGGSPKKLAEMAPMAWQGPVEWSPDGKYVAALGYPWPEEDAVFVVPASGGELRRLTAPEERGYKQGLAWHPDGQRLTYVHYVTASPSTRAGSDSEVREAYLDGRPSSLLFKRPDWVGFGTWTPDGTHFFFSSLKAGVWQFNRYDAETGAFTHVATNIGRPSWSRDGKTVVWEVARSASQLWLIENFR